MYMCIYIYVCIYVCMQVCRPINVCLGIYACTMYIKFCAIDCALGRKIMKDLTGPGRDRVDRLPLLVSGQNIVKLLSVPKLHDGTAVTMMNSVVDSMDE